MRDATVRVWPRPRTVAIVSAPAYKYSELIDGWVVKSIQAINIFVHLNRSHADSQVSTESHLYTITIGSVYTSVDKIVFVAGD